VVVALERIGTVSSEAQAFRYVRALAPGPLSAVALTGIPLWLIYSAATRNTPSLMPWFVAVTCSALSALAFWLPSRERKHPLRLDVGETGVTLPRPRVRNLLDSVTYAAIIALTERSVAGGRRLLTITTTAATYRLPERSFESPQHYARFVGLLRERTGHNAINPAPPTRQDAP
jgi:hypothetical protein